MTYDVNGPMPAPTVKRWKVGPLTWTAGALLTGALVAGTVLSVVPSGMVNEAAISGDGKGEEYDEGIVGSVEEYRGPEVLMEAPKEGQCDAECEEEGEAQWDDVDGSKDGSGEDDCHGWSETPGEAIEKRTSEEDFFP